MFSFTEYMDNPLYPIGAEIVISELLLQQNHTKKNSFPIYFYKRYVDDIIRLVPSNNTSEIIRNLLIKFHT